MQRWIQAKMCYQGQPLPFLLPLTNIFFKLYFKNSTPLVAYGDASLNPWLAEGSVQHPYVLTFPQIFQTPRRVFLSHLSFPTFLPSSTTSSVVSPEAAEQLLPEKLCFLPTSSLQLRQTKTSCQSVKLKQMKASSPSMQLQQFQQMKVPSPSMQLKHVKVYALAMQLQQQMKAHKEETKEGGEEMNGCASSVKSSPTEVNTTLTLYSSQASQPAS